MRIEVDGDRLVVSPVPAASRNRLAALPGSRWAALLGGYTLPATAAAAGNLRVTAPEADWSPDALQLLGGADRALEARAHRTAEELPDLPDGKTPSAWLHQRQAFNFARDQEAAGLWVAMGGGKGRIAVNVADHHGAERVLVGAPRSVLDDDRVWQKEFARWSDRGWKVGGLVMRRDGKGTKAKPSVADRLRQLERDLAEAEVRGQPFAAVVPWDVLWRAPLSAWLLERDWDLWILDEVHRIKAPGGKASKMADRLRPRCRRRLGLSGTPMPHSRLDAYAVYRALDPGVFGTAYARFKARYARTVPLPNAPRAEKVVGWQNEDEFDRKFHSIAYVWEQDREVLGLQEPVWVERRVPLEAAARSIYEDLNADLIADVGKGVVTAGNALVRLLRLQQVCSGVVKLADGTKTRVGDEKKRKLAEVLEDLPVDEPVVVVCRFTSDLDTVHEVARGQGRSTAELSGRIKSLDLWKNGGADVLALQIQAGGVGIDLTRARYCVLQSVGFSLGDFDQVLARLDRPGQAHQVVFVKVVAANTVDEEVYAALDSRRDAVEAVLANRRRR